MDTDQKLQDECVKYMKDKQVNELFERLFTALSIQKPKDPATFLIDLLERREQSFNRVMIVGKTNSGKSTLCKNMIETNKWIAITKECLLSPKEDPNVDLSGTEFFARLSDYLKKNESSEKGQLFVGLPENRAQALELQKRGLFFNHIFMLDVDDDVVFARELAKEKSKQRSVEEMKKDLSRYMKNISLVLDCYKELHNITPLSGVSPAKKVFCEVQNVLNGDRNLLNTKKFCVFFPEEKSELWKKIQELFGVVIIHLDTLFATQKQQLKAEFPNKSEEEQKFECFRRRVSELDCKTCGWCVQNFPTISNSGKKSISSIDLFVQNSFFPDALVGNFDSEPESVKNQYASVFGENFIQIDKTLFENLKKGTHFHQVVDILRGTKQKPIKKIFAIGALQLSPAFSELASSHIRRAGLIAISAESVIKECIAEKNSVGKEAQQFVNSKKACPDHLICKAIEWRISQKDAISKGYFLDNFPLTVTQAKILNELCIVPTTVILWDASESRISPILQSIADKCSENASASKSTTNSSTNDSSDSKKSSSNLNPNSNDTQSLEIRAKNDLFLISQNIQAIEKHYQSIPTVRVCWINGNRSQTRFYPDFCSIVSGHQLKLKICIAGAPASGKGTQAFEIKQRYGIIHLSTGDIFRDAVARGTDFGKKIKHYMDNGLLVPDSLVLDVLSERLEQDDIKLSGFLLDGFPRTPAQAEFMLKKGIFPDSFIYLETPDEVVIQRITGRRVDPVSGNSYHMSYNPPPNAQVAARLVQRSDDTEEKVITRLEFFHANISSIEKYFEDVEFEVDGNQPKDVVTKAIFDELDSVCKKNHLSSKLNE